MATQLPAGNPVLFLPHRTAPPPVTLRQMELAELGAEVRTLIRKVEALPIYSALALLAVGGAAALAGQFYITTQGQSAMRIGALLAGLALAQWLCSEFAIAPLKRRTFERASVRLAEHLSSEKVRKRMLRSWWGPRPGVISLAESGGLLLIDSSTDYNLRHIPASDIRLVGIHVIARGRSAPALRQHLRDAGDRQQRSYRWSLHGTPTPGVYLEIRYRTAQSGDAFISLVPFGADARGAQAMREALGMNCSAE